MNSYRKMLACAALLATLSAACNVAYQPPSSLVFSRDQTSVSAQSVSAPIPTAVPDRERVQIDQQEQVLINIYQRVNPGVVYIAISTQSSRRGGGLTPTSSGSGFVVDKQGHIVTNNHVVEGASQIDVSFANGATARATVVGTDPYSDLAVIKVDVPAEALLPVELGDSSSLQPGQRVAAIGNPYGLVGTMTQGIISAIGRTLPESSLSNGAGSGSFVNPEIIQTDAAINPGNSGGPLLDSHGRVIGVNTAIQATNNGTGQASNSGIGFAVPVNTVKRVVNSLIAEGRMHYPYLGVTSSDVLNVALIADQLNIPAGTKGVLVFEVAPGGPGDKAGLRGGSSTHTADVSGQQVPLGGDVITAFNDRPVKNYADLISKLTENSKPGDVVALTIYRDGKVQTVKVTLGERP